MQTDPVASARILIVGMDPGEVECLAGRLREWGHRVCATVPSVREAAERAAELHPELALIDVEQAAAGGEDGEIADLPELPSVYLVGCGEEERLSRAAKTSPYACVLKPLDDGQLRLNIDAVLANHARERKGREERAQATARLEGKIADQQRELSIAYAALDNMRDGVVLTDDQGQYLLINRTARSTFSAAGVGPDDALEFLSEPLDFRHAADMTPCPPDEQPAARVLRGESFDDYDLCVVGGPDRRFYFTTSGRPFLDDAGNLRGGMTVFRDVTEAHLKEKKLQEMADSLLQQKHAMETVFNSISDGVVAADEMGNFTIFNPAAERIVGMGATDSGPDEWSDTYGLFQVDQVTPFPAEDVPLARALRGESCDEVPMFTRNRHVPEGAFLSVSGRPLRDPDGGLTGGVVVFRDVTLLRQTEQHLKRAAENRRQQNELMETVFNSIADGVIVVGDDNRVVVFNPSARRMLGIEDAVPAVSEWDRDDYLRLADGETCLAPDEYPIVAALRGESTNERDLYVPSRDIYVSAHGRPLRDKLGRLRGGVAVFRDVTPLKLAERRLQQAVNDLQQQNDFMETVFNSINDGVVAADARGRLTMVNRSAERLVGKPLLRGSDAALAMDRTFFRDTVTPVPEDELPLSRALKGESRANVELYLAAASDAEGIYISASAGPMRDADGAPTGGVITFHDVTQRVHAREALLQAFARGRMEIIDTVLHNIGNAINSVAVGMDTIVKQSGNNQLLRRFTALADAAAAHEEDWIEWLSTDPQGQRLRPFLLALVSDLAKRNESLNGTARRVSDRVRHIVDIIRTQEAFTTARVQRKVIDLREAIADAVRTLQDSLAKRSIEVDVDCARAPDEILVQESQFHQMLVNLLKNAMEAIDDLGRTGRGAPPGPRIRIVAWSDEGHITLDVTDNGIGVDPGSVREIFTAGYTTKKSGTGLGLHSAANFVVGSGGTIEPLSRGIGQGTTMRVRLRLPGIPQDDRPRPHQASR